MRINDIIRNVLDMIDQVESGGEIIATAPVEEVGAYQDSDVKRFKQIVDLAQSTPYTTEPQEAYADIDAVTNNAGADSMNGTKDPADIRGEHPSLYPGTVYGAR